MKISKHYGNVICTQDNPMVLLKDIKELLIQEKLTWDTQSIGHKAVESIEKALEEATK